MNSSLSFVQNQILNTPAQKSADKHSTPTSVQDIIEKLRTTKLGYKSNEIVSDISKNAIGIERKENCVCQGDPTVMLHQLQDLETSPSLKDRIQLV